MIIIRYLTSGGTAALVNFSLLYALVELGNFWYLSSAIMSFGLAFFVGFGLQKFWTFQDNNKKRMPYQMSLYFTLGLVNLGINTLSMYILVDKLHIWYMFSQMFVSAFLAIISFVIYKFVIFSHSFKAIEGKN